TTLFRSVQDLVPGRLVGVAQLVVDRPARAEDEQVGGGRAGAQPLAAQLGGLGLQQEGSGRGQLADEQPRRQLAGTQLPGDGGGGAVVEEVAERQGGPVVGGRVQGQGGAAGADGDGPVDAP